MRSACATDIDGERGFTSPFYVACAALISTLPRRRDVLSERDGDSLGAAELVAPLQLMRVLGCALNLLPFLPRRLVAQRSVVMRYNVVVHLGGCGVCQLCCSVRFRSHVLT